MAFGLAAVAKFKQNAEKIKRLYEGFQFARTMDVVVGITEESDQERDGISNAQLLYLHENGVPSHNIPPRPVLKPALRQEQVRSQIKKLMKDGMKQAMIHGNIGAAEQCYHKAGMVGRDACKNYITDGTHLAPNAPETIARKGSDLPLVDTASMLNSITYAVRRKK